MPSGSLLPSGTYQLIATATDRAGLAKTVTISVTVAVKTLATSRLAFATSGVELSFAEASANQAHLYFTAPLRAASLQSFSLTADGAPLFVTSVGTNDTILTLHLSRALLRGERLTLAWRDLCGEDGLLFSGQTGLVAE